MSKKRIIALITVIVLLFAAGISVGVFLYTRGTTQAADGTQPTDQNQVADGENQTTDVTQTGDSNENPVTNPDKCEFVSWNKPVEKKCPKCGSYMVEKGTKNVKLLCSNENCGYSEDKEQQD